MVAPSMARVQTISVGLGLALSLASDLLRVNVILRQVLRQAQVVAR